VREQVYVVEIRKPGGDDDDWFVAFYAEDVRAPGAYAMGVFGNARDSQNAAGTFKADEWETRVRLARLKPSGKALRVTGRGVSA